METPRMLQSAGSRSCVLPPGSVERPGQGTHEICYEKTSAINLLPEKIGDLGTISPLE
jgi:hypothetical protein